MATPRRTVQLSAVGAAATMLLSGCTIFQDAFQIGKREFTFDTAAEAKASSESFRFQGFLPDDATDIRLVAQLDSDENVFQWTSPTPFTSELCTEGAVSTEPRIDAQWLPESLPDEGHICGTWTVVHSGDVHYAWN
ncbi:MULTISPECIES: hypothetical protein [unclassified Brachybacterium]|uniref:hypothetical protein n=1 Tax=unclassified Brachybacterium TaxID=2623841 RepID=UPI00360E0CF9